MDHHHRHKNGDDKLWRLTYADEDEIEIYSKGENQDGGTESSDENGKRNHLESVEETNRLVGSAGHFGYHHGNRRRYKKRIVTLGNKVKDNIQRIKIYERKRRERFDDDDDDDDEYENQTVVTTYELPPSSSSSIPINHHHHHQPSEDEGEEMEKEDFEMQESRDDDGRTSSSSPSRGTRPPRILIRRDSDLDLLVNRVNTFDLFGSCLRCQHRLDAGCSCFHPARVRMSRCMEWTGMDRRLYGLPRWFKVFLVISVCMLGMLVYATIVTVGVKVILAQ